jgi:hypothetical protein
LCFQCYQISTGERGGNCAAPHITGNNIALPVTTEIGTIAKLSEDKGKFKVSFDFNASI